MELETIGMKAKQAASQLNHLGQSKKNEVLMSCATLLENNVAYILSENKKDIDHAHTIQMKDSLIDRLKLTKERIHMMADGLRNLVTLKDPIGEVVSSETRPNGLFILNRRVPIGVVGIIYESRPNVTADAFGLCFKTGNAVILRGGSDSINSNIAIVNVLKQALIQESVTPDAVELIEDTSHETAAKFMKMNQFVDVLIPRGGKRLIETAVKESTIPVIETGTGNCHAYVDAYADFDMALNIIDNAKTQRLGVCNALESLVIHSAVLEQFLPLLYQRLTEKQIVFYADERARQICPLMEIAQESDFKTEYLDRCISVKTVDSIDEAIAHINSCSTGHSETIITKDYKNAMHFLDDIDSACVYVNASTRFTDGQEFGLGAEIGISTQKLHARGPMGLQALTTTKYVIFGEGQIRP